MTAPIDPRATFDHLRNPAFSSFLDLSRWAAAWIVFLGHLRNPLFYGFGAAGDAANNPIVIVWYFVTGWFGEAVIVFFVLSGYLVGGIGLAKQAAGSFDPRKYAIDRFSRLYVAYLPALVLTAVLGAIGLHFFAATGLYDGTQAMLAVKLEPPFPVDVDSPGHFLANLAMLQTFRTEPFGSNPPLWTISAEFWFYVAFGLAMLAWAGRGWRRLAWSALLVGCAVFLTPTFLYYLGLWIAGIGAALMPARWARLPLLWAALLLAVLVCSRLFESDILALEAGQAVRDYGVAITFALFLQSMRCRRDRWLVRTAVINRHLADFSFSLYLVHFPLMLFALSAAHATGLFPGIATGYSPTDPDGLALYAGFAVGIALFAWVFAQLTEMRTHLVRRRLTRWVGARDAREAPLPTN